MADTSPIAKDTPPARRWFRFDLLELFGMVTLACLSMGAVMALRDGPREDLAFLAIVLSFTLVGIALGRNVRGTTIFWAPLCAGLAGFSAMKIFQTSWWFEQSANSFAADTPYFDATWQAILASSLMAATIGLLVTLGYLLSLWFVRQGPGGVWTYLKLHRVRAFAILSAMPLLFLTMWSIDRAFFGGGPSPYLRINSKRYPGSAMVLSPSGDWVAIREDGGQRISSSGVWQFYRIGKGQLHREYYFRDEFSGAPSFSPDGRYFVYQTPYGNSFIRNVKDGQAVGYFDSKQLDGSVRSVRWVPDGRLITSETEHNGPALSVWSFDGTNLSRQRRRVLADNESLLGIGSIAAVVETHQDDKLHVAGEALASGKSTWRSTMDHISRDGTFEAALTAATALTSDGKVGVFDNWCINLQTGDVREFLPAAIFGFTSRDYLLAFRHPYARFQRWIFPVGPFEEPTPMVPYVPPLWSQIPLGKRVLEALEYSQLVFIDPRSNQIVAKLGAVRGEILCAAASANNEVVAAIAENDDAEGEYDYDLYLWHMPPACR